MNRGEREMECTCGNHVNEDGNPDPRQPIHNDHQLDYSFIHLPAPPPPAMMNGSNKAINDSTLFNHGFLSAHRYMSTLLQITTDSLNYGRDTNENEDSTYLQYQDRDTVCLCHSCIQRISNAIDDNTEQLEVETLAYIRAVEEEKDKERRLKKALSINAGIHNGELATGQHKENELVQSTILAFQHELTSLERECEEHEKELANLNELIDEQSRISDTLSLQEEALLLEYNILEKDAKVFDDIHRQLAQQCHYAERERSNLSRVRLHSTLFDIFVDDKGLRYPLINNLRLSHRPKNDLTWIEINSAWSQATQLLMFMSSTARLTSRNFGIVPLHCAKIIEVDSAGKKMYHHLGVDVESIDRKSHNTEHIIASLRVFYRLFYQLFVHVKGSKLCTGSVPFEMTSHVVGKFNLELIEDNDDKSWIAVINCIASNMRWLSYQL